MNTAIAHLDWDAIYLTCFGVGFVLSLLALAGGFLHLHVGHWHFGGHGHLLSKAGAQGHASGQMAPVNGFTLVAFLCWFGGTGYLLAHGGVFAWALVLGLSVLSGLAGAGLVFWFLARVLLPRERTLEPADTPMVGVLGRVSASVPRNGVGEMLYTQNGARRSMPICSEDGAPIDRNAEVVVLRYQRGIGYVRRWDELQHSLMGDDAPLAQNLD
ncbi:MAG TPA: hypothetical protein VKV02_15250 [Acidobacteriaceae bacterium]|nr:hypothetical protein [Acidobacteriaceae bacterium]